MQRTNLAARVCAAVTEGMPLTSAIASAAIAPVAARRGRASLREAVRAGLTRPEGRFWSRSDHLHGFFEQQWRAMVLNPSQKIARAFDRSGTR